MAWDSSRTVPWRRLVREWLIYVVIASVAMTIYFVTTNRTLEVGLYAGLLVSGPMYIAFGAVLAKFGYQRKSFKDLRSERATAPATTSRGSTSGGSATSSSQTQRVRPAPTKRTSTGPQHRKPKKR
ncbi:MAG: hypothetical protein ABIR32_12960 [Ilumatobacteraceae bacterium]